MSLWYCETHGLVGPMACCRAASRAMVRGDVSMDALESVITVTASDTGTSFVPSPAQAVRGVSIYRR